MLLSPIRLLQERFLLPTLEHHTFRLQAKVFGLSLLMHSLQAELIRFFFILMMVVQVRHLA
jgi:hypothetical protein